MKGMFFFGHDDNALTDDKIERLIVRTSGFSYGVYWAVLERLHREGGYVAYDNETFKLIGMRLCTNASKIKKIIDEMIEIGLFHRTDDDKIYFDEEDEE